MELRESDTPVAFGATWGPEKSTKKTETVKPSVRRKQEVTYHRATEEVFRPLNKANALSEFEIEECKEAFSTFDPEGQGHVKTDILGHLLKMMGHVASADEISHILDEVDEDGSGILHFKEFLFIMASFKVDEEEDIREAFMLMDSKNQGNIGAVELQRVMERLGHSLSEDEATSMIREADTTGNGRISYEEFVAMMTKTT